MPPITPVATMPSQKDIRDKIEPLLLGENFSREQIREMLSAPEGLATFTYFFLLMSIFETKNQKTRIMALQEYLQALNEVNRAYKDWMHNSMAIYLKIILDCKGIVERAAKLVTPAEEVELKKESQELQSCLQEYIDKKKKLAVDELRERFATFDFSTPATFSSCFQDFPEEELWRFYVDGRYQKMLHERGWVKYEEREANSLNELHKACKMALASEAQLTVGLIEHIHQAAIGGVAAVAQHAKLRGGNKVRYMMVDFTLLGLDELLNSVAKEWRDYDCDTETTYSDNKRYFSATPKRYIALAVTWKKNTDYEIKMTLQAMLDKYESALSHAKGDKFTLFMAIIEFCSSLLRFHPFNDGNGRVAINILLNRELLRSGFPPVILENPNFFDNLSQTELANEVLSGMENFAYVKQHGIYPGASHEALTTAAIKQSLITEGETRPNLLNPIPEGFDLPTKPTPVDAARTDFKP